MINFPDRLKNARKMCGFSLQDLSDKLSNRMSKQELSRFENGESNPDSSVLDDMCLALNVRLDYFFRDSTVSLDDVEFRKLKKLTVKDREKIQSITTEHLERYLELENLLGIDNSFPFTPRTIPVSSHEDIEKAADSVRKKFGCGFDPIHNIAALLEDNNIKVIWVDAPQAFSGMSTIIDKKIGVIVLNSSTVIPIVRKRLTALHELGHLVLNLETFEEKEKEKYCNAFAAAVLLPREKLKEAFGGWREKVYGQELKMIKQYFGISLSAIMHRAFSLELISASHLKYFSIRYNQYYRKQENLGYSGSEKSDRFLQLIIRAIAQGIISTSKGAALCNQSLSDFRSTLLDAS
ncbi:MAG: XRE family transcriptional regulator [Bacteroidetes bacterium]|nr:XRE family transcriptional regulator [Bacteroidota bacterium]MBU1718035.1 XRE family transcriptional regulator [Bacteroidota bacterium]